MTPKGIRRLFGAGFAALLMMQTLAAGAQTSQPPRALSVSGTGTVLAIPDIVSISAGVESRAQSAGQALAANTAAMQRAFDLLRRSGVANTDMQTSNFSITPDYYQDKQGRVQTGVVVGYRVSNQLNVTVRQIASLGAILDALVTQGVNNIHNINFSVSKPQSRMDQARQKAVADARRKAMIYAQAAGAKLGRILSLTEQSGRVQPRRHYAARAMVPSSAPVPIAGGEQSLRVTISVRWELE